LHGSVADKERKVVGTTPGPAAADAAAVDNVVAPKAGAHLEYGFRSIAAAGAARGGTTQEDTDILRTTRQRVAVGSRTVHEGSRPGAAQGS